MPFRLVLQIALAASVLLASGCQKGVGDTTPKATILPVSAIVVRRQKSFTYPVTYYGRIEPARHSALSFELPGRLEEVLVDEGGFIGAGQVVARLDTSALVAERDLLLTQRKTESLLLDRLRRGERVEVIAAARAVAMRLEVELRRTLADKNRAEQIYADRAISRSDYDKALFSHKAAVFSLEQAQQRLEELESGSRSEDIDAQASRVAAIDARHNQLEVQFDKSVLLAPFDGVCIQRLQDEGVTLSPGQIVLEINEANRLEARFSIPQQNLNLIAPAKYLEINGDQHSISGARAISQVDDTMRTVDIVIPLQVDAEDRILPGQTCTLVVAKRVEADCVELPISALVASVRGLWSCYRLQHDPPGDQTYKVEKVEVSVIHTNGTKVFVSSSIRNRSLIIPDGVHRVVPGMRVRIVDDQP
jgi:multidrug efflux pump subunit AcrA (membrane-fusion protein)